MKRIVYTIAIGMIAAGCASRPIKIITPCPKYSTKDIIANASALVLAEGMQITVANETVGVLQASSAPEREIWSGMMMTKMWSFTVRDSMIEAQAKTYTSSQNAFGATTSTAETYYDDHVHPDHAWYWNVRNGLATLCGTQVRFVKQGSKDTTYAPDPNAQKNMAE